MAVSDAFVNLSVFRGRIRTGISRGLCEIDFSAVTQEIAWVEEDGSLLFEGRSDRPKFRIKFTGM